MKKPKRYWIVLTTRIKTGKNLNLPTGVGLRITKRTVYVYKKKKAMRNRDLKVRLLVPGQRFFFQNKNGNLFQDGFVRAMIKM